MAVYIFFLEITTFLELLFFLFLSLIHYILVWNPAGGPTAVWCLAASEAPAASKTSTRGSPAPASLPGLTEDPPRRCVGYRCLPGPGDYRLQSGAALRNRCKCVKCPYLLAVTSRHKGTPLRNKHKCVKCPCCGKIFALKCMFSKSLCIFGS